MIPADAEQDPLQEAVNAVLDEHGGDARKALRAAIEANAELLQELQLTRAAVSSGYSRQWHRRRAQEA